jgi:ribosome maturation factor RimP
MLRAPARGFIFTRVRPRTGSSGEEAGIDGMGLGPIFCSCSVLRTAVHSALKERLLGLLETPVTAMGYELVDVDACVGANGLLRLYIDQDAGIDLDDCERVSRQIGTFLDVEAAMPGSYTLEVSSPGLDRPLRTVEHFTRFVDQEAKIRLAVPIDGRRNFRGHLRGVEDEHVLIDVDGVQWRLPLTDIAAAHLVPEF